MKKKKTLKKYKEEYSNINEDKKENFLKKIIKDYPNDSFSYNELINYKTNNYNKLLTDDELSNVKEIYEKAFEKININEKLVLKDRFENYLYDHKNYNYLVKIRKEITSKLLLNKINSNILISLNQNINYPYIYNDTGIKIRSSYDLIKGLFYIFLFIFNIIKPNFLLIVTTIFFIFGVINVYSFLDTVLFKKGILKKQKDEYLKSIVKEKDLIKELKNNIIKNEDDIIRLRLEKQNQILNLPKTFVTKNITNDDENKIAELLFNSYETSNMAIFSTLLKENTILSLENVNDLLNYYIENSKLLSLINNDVKVKKEKLIKASKMQSVNHLDISLAVIFCFLSILSILYVFRSNSVILITKKPFIISIVVGLINGLIYNIITGRNSSIINCFFDNLISSCFSSVLVYDIIYLANGHAFDFLYLFIKVPILFSFLLSSVIMISSILKYNNFLKRLRN